MSAGGGGGGDGGRRKLTDKSDILSVRSRASLLKLSVIPDFAGDDEESEISDGRRPPRSEGGSDRAEEAEEREASPRKREAAARSVWMSSASGVVDPSAAVKESVLVGVVASVSSSCCLRVFPTLSCFFWFVSFESIFAALE